MAHSLVPHAARLLDAASQSAKPSCIESQAFHALDVMSASFGLDEPSLRSSRDALSLAVEQDIARRLSHNGKMRARLADTRAGQERTLRSIVFWGDSTVAHMFTFLTHMMRIDAPITNRTVIVPILNSTARGIESSSLEVWTATGSLCGYQISACFAGDRQGAGPSFEHAATLLAEVASGSNPPVRFVDVQQAWSLVVGAAGLHKLHLEPTRPEEDRAAWIDREDRISTGLGKLQVFASPSTLLRYHTIHSVCNERLLPREAEEAARYLAGRGTCTWDGCQEATFTRDGSARWHDTEVRVVRTFPRWQLPDVDAFGLTDGQCWATSDGRHYDLLAPAMVMRTLFDRWYE